METPCIGSTPIRSAPQHFPQRCLGMSMGQLIHAVNAIAIRPYAVPC
jgi:hypothetical protein